MAILKWNRVDQNAPTDRADFVRVWMIDLYYGDLKQAKEKLHVVNSSGEYFCCLGVATIKFGYKPMGRGNIKSFGSGKTNAELPFPLSRFLQIDGTGRSIDDSHVYKAKMFKKEVRKFIQTIYPKNTINAKYAVSLAKYAVSLAGLNDTGISFPIIAKVLQNFCDRYLEGLTEEEKTYIKDTKLTGKHDDPVSI